MCDDGGRPGPIRAAWDRLRGRSDPPADGRTADPPDVGEWLKERDAARDRRAGRPRCERCGSVRAEDDAIMHRRWCSSCDTSWVEDWVLYPLVARLGRKGARAALVALVKGEIGPTAWK